MAKQKQHSRVGVLLFCWVSASEGIVLLVFFVSYKLYRNRNLSDYLKRSNEVAGK